MNIKSISQAFVVAFVIAVVGSITTTGHAQTATSSSGQGRPTMPPQGGDRGFRPAGRDGGMMGRPDSASSSVGFDGNREPRRNMMSSSTAPHMNPPAGTKLPQSDGQQGDQRDGQQQVPNMMRPVVAIDENGHITLRGTLSSVDGHTLTIKTWGLVFTVDATNASATPITVGDIVGVQGNISDSSVGHVVAKNVRDITLYKPMMDRASSTRMMGGDQGGTRPMMQARPKINPATQQSQVSAGGGIFDFLNNLFKVR